MGPKFTQEKVYDLGKHSLLQELSSYMAHFQAWFMEKLLYLSVSLLKDL